MSFAKPIAFGLVWLLVLFAMRYLVPGLGETVEPRTALFVVAIPWLVSFAGSGPRAVFCALRDGFASRAGELPPDRRRYSAGLLRRLGGLSLSAGVFAFFATSIAALNGIALTGGQGNPMEIVARAGPSFLAPLYGFLLLAFVYGPLAAGLEAEDSGLGLDLED